MNDSPSLKNSSLTLVKMSKSVKHITARTDLINDIVILMKSLSSLHELKETNLFEVIKRVCELIENGDYNSQDPNLKLNKKDIAIDSLLALFPDLNNDKDKKYISQSIDTFCNSKMVKKLSTSRFIKKTVWPFLKRKFL
jgi:hypothetical protein